MRTFIAICFAVFITANAYFSVNIFMKVEVVVVDPIPLPGNFGKKMNTKLRAITTAQMVWLL